QPTKGEILIDGKPVAGVPPYERDVNTVFQDYALFPHMSVAENVAYGLMIRKVPKAPRLARAEEMLGMVALGGLGGRKPSHLAGAAAAALPGAPAAFSIRPEKIRIAPAGTQAPGSFCAVDGTITSVLYLGASTRFNVALAAGGELTVIEQNREETASSALARQGQVVRLIWQRGHIQAMRP